MAYAARWGKRATEAPEFICRNVTTLDLSTRQQIVVIVASFADASGVCIV